MTTNTKVSFCLFDNANLFTERYKELIQTGNGTPVDNISHEINFSAKKRLCTVMLNFAEPAKINANRYDNIEITTNAFELAVERLNSHIGYPAVQIDRFQMTDPLDLLASHFTPYLLDVIELQYDNLSKQEKETFRERINGVFQVENIHFELLETGMINRVVSYEILDCDIEKSVETITEIGLKDLLNEAISLHKQSNYAAHRIATEKIWDAYERLKTYHADLGKKESTEKIITDMAGGEEAFRDLFNDEFYALTKIGNNFRIRHHETDKTDITNQQFYDYFFNRCLSLIVLAIQYLQ